MNPISVPRAFQTAQGILARMGIGMQWQKSRPRFLVACATSKNVKKIINTSTWPFVTIKAAADSIVRQMS